MTTKNCCQKNRRQNERLQTQRIQKERADMNCAKIHGDDKRLQKKWRQSNRRHDDRETKITGAKIKCAKMRRSQNDPKSKLSEFKIIWSQYDPKPKWSEVKIIRSQKDPKSKWTWTKTFFHQTERRQNIGAKYMPPDAYHCINLHYKIVNYYNCSSIREVWNALRDFRHTTLVRS